MDAVVLAADAIPALLECQQVTIYRKLDLLSTCALPLFVCCFTRTLGGTSIPYKAGERLSRHLTSLRRVADSTSGILLVPLLLLFSGRKDGFPLCILDRFGEPDCWTWFFLMLGTSSVTVFYSKQRILVCFYMTWNLLMMFVRGRAEMGLRSLRITVFVLHHLFFRACFVQFPRTFSFTEGLVLCQILSLILGLSLFVVIGFAPDFTTASAIVNWISLTVVTTAVFCIGAVVLEHVVSRREIRTVAQSTWAGFVGLAFFCCTRTSNVSQPLGSILANRKMIISFWIAVLGGGISVLSHFAAKLQCHGIFYVRKAFHGLGIIMFGPVLVSGDVEFLALAIAVAMCVFIVVETLRNTNDRVISPCLKRWFDRFVDERDRGSLITTHLHLLLGFGLPVLIGWGIQIEHPNLPQRFIPWTGVVMVGVSDAAAALFGKKIGRHKLSKNCKKTYEGAIAFIISGLATVFFLHTWVIQIADTGRELVAIVIAICAGAVYEVGKLI